jgi:ribosome-binding factor A
MPSPARARRIGERVRQELAELLQRDVSDPRLAMITVTDVEVDRELAYATVYVSAFPAEKRKDEILAALQGASGYLRRELAARVRLRTFPRLRFRWDASPDRGARIEELLAGLRAGDAAGPSPEEDGPAPDSGDGETHA